jgi:hypothetical protein
VAVGLLIFAGEAIVVGIERLTVFRRESFYPVYAVDFLKTNSTPDRIFSMYEWGGYLIWQLPEKKVFIDGRMLPYMSKTKTDQEYLFKEYLQATQKREVLTDLLDRYSVNKVLWANTGNYRKSGFGDWIAKTFFPSLVNNAVKGGVVDWLTDSGWQKQYEDDVAVILFRTVDK